MREPGTKTTFGIARIVKILSKPIYADELAALKEFIGDFDYNYDDGIETLRLFNKLHDENKRLYEANMKLLKQINAKKPFSDIIFNRKEAELMEDNIAMNNSAMNGGAEQKGA